MEKERNAEMKVRLGWLIYSVFFSVLAVGRLVSFFYPDSPIYAYHNVLITFNEDYTLPWALSVGSALLGVLSIPCLLLFAFEFPVVARRLWQFIFWARFILEFVGRSYEIKLFKSLFYSNVFHALCTLAVFLVLLLPSYYACYRFAFRQDKLSLK